MSQGFVMDLIILVTGDLRMIFQIERRQLTQNIQRAGWFGELSDLIISHLLYFYDGSVDKASYIKCLKDVNLFSSLDEKYGKGGHLPCS